MEKRLVVFIMLSVAIMVAYTGLKVAFGPPPVAKKDAPENPEAADQDAGKDGDPKKDGKKQDPQLDGDPNQAQDPDEAKQGDEPKAAQDNEDPPKPEVEADAFEEGNFPERHLVLGSYGQRDEGNLVAYAQSAGATIECVELVERRKNGKFRFRNLDRDHGYLGYLSLSPAANGGARIGVVAKGTPADNAKSNSGISGGLKPGDEIISFGDQMVLHPSEIKAMIEVSHPGDEITLGVRRDINGANQELTFTAVLGTHPMELIQLEPDAEDDVTPSFLMTLQSLNGLRLKDKGELSGLNMHHADWEVLDATKNRITFRYQIPQAVLKDAGLSGSLAVVKQFTLPKSGGNGAPHHVQLSIKFDNQCNEPVQLAYRLEGPNGLPLEGWWYATKPSPHWGGAGARDVVYRVEGKGHRLISTSKIHKQADKQDSWVPLLSGKPDERTLRYVGVDTQYFSAVFVPGTFEKPQPLAIQNAEANPVGALITERGRIVRTQNTSFTLESMPRKIAAGDSFSQDFTVYLGPKDPKVLPAYDLEALIEFGWFGWVSRRLAWVLHLFYGWVGLYGIAIIMLTVLVRGCMFPLGRKAARNAQMMQELSPEIKKINEKYKTDMEKRAAATRELWRKHNFHPLGGCWLMFLQLPIFIGLYRCLSVDIELRQAPLIPGLSWCSNLSGPDKLWYWHTDMLSMFTAETGWLGPYLNVLPIITIALFLVQQKLFTPPPTDEQSAMQQKMMKYMMVFFGVLFFKVASGLCLYFIASSLWGIAERKLLPKPKKPQLAEEGERKPSLAERINSLVSKEDNNGATMTPQERRKQRQKRK